MAIHISEAEFTLKTTPYVPSPSLLSLTKSSSLCPVRWDVIISQRGLPMSPPALASVKNGLIIIMCSQDDFWSNLNCVSSLFIVPLLFHNIRLSWILLKSSIDELALCLILVDVGIIARILMELGIRDGEGTAELQDFLVWLHPGSLEEDLAPAGVDLSQDVTVCVVGTLLSYSKGHVLAGVVGQVGQCPWLTCKSRNPTSVQSAKKEHSSKKLGELNIVHRTQPARLDHWNTGLDCPSDTLVIVALINIKGGSGGRWTASQLITWLLTCVPHVEVPWKGHHWESLQGITQTSRSWCEKPGNMQHYTSIVPKHIASGWCAKKPSLHVPASDKKDNRRCKNLLPWTSRRSAQEVLRKLKEFKEPTFMANERRIAAKPRNMLGWKLKMPLKRLMVFKSICTGYPLTMARLYTDTYNFSIIFQNETLSCGKRCPPYPHLLQKEETVSFWIPRLFPL